MPLTSIPYNSNYGEWYPYNGNNYSQRARSLFFFRSMNYSEDETPGYLIFRNEADYRPIPSDAYVWPNDVSGPRSFWNDGTPMYKVFLRETAIHVILTSPPDGSPQEDYDIALKYQEVLHEYLNKDITYYLNWGKFQPDPISSSDLIDLTDYQTRIYRPFPYVSPIDRSEYNNESYDIIKGGTSPTTGDPNNFPYTEGDEYDVMRFYYNASDGNDGPGEGIEIRTNGGLVEWNPSAASYTTVSGDFIESKENFGEIGDYIQVSNSEGGGSSPYNGRTFKILNKWEKGALNLDLRKFYYEIKMQDGLGFTETSNEFFNNITNVSKRPRLTIKYRVPNFGSLDDVSTEGNSYKFYSSYTDGNPTYLTWNQVDFSANRLQVDAFGEEGAAIFIGNDELAPVGGSMNFAHVHGKLHTGIQSTFNSEDERITTWRKAYRYLNRFNTTSVVIDHSDGPNSDYGTSGKGKFKLKPDHVHDKNAFNGVAIEYPKAIPHRPPCLYSSSPEVANSTIVIGNRVTSTELVSGNWFETEDNGNLRWGVYNINQWIPEDDQGIVVEEKSSPNKIYFTVNLEDNGNGSTEFANYDYSGLISCKGTVVPAYSGEILQFDDNYGFMNTNYTNESVGLANVSAVLLDISETDEVLRWNGSNYDAAQHWRNTFDYMQVTNVRLGETQIFSKHRSLKQYTSDDKINYKVVMYNEEIASWDTSSWQTDDEITITLVNKKIIKNSLAQGNPEGMEYVPISYRPLEEENLNDYRIDYAAPESGQLFDFTIESNGLENGNITIQYLGDVSDVTFKLYEQDIDE